MRINKLYPILLLFLSSLVAAQVLSPMELTDPAMRRLQARHQDDLKTVASELAQHKFPYAFYFSRKLDIEEQEQKQADQRSIRFERYNNHTTLEITGNYFASYSSDQLDAEHRMRKTFSDVMLPILQIVAPKFTSDDAIEYFGIEISHHVRKKVMGSVRGEFPENVVVLIPREVAARLVQTSDPTAQQNLMLDAEVYISGQPTVLWLAGERPVVVDEVSRHTSKAKIEMTSSPSAPDKPQSPLPGAKLPTLGTATEHPELKNEPVHEATPQGLNALLERNRDTIAKMTREQNEAAHFVQYAPPAFIEFKKGTYLQLSMTSTLDAAAAGSQYKLAALAFDRHIAHLIRPILAYFKGTTEFDGIDFSTTVKIPGDDKDVHTEAVEFVIPIAALRRYEQFDSTGQQLLNEGIVLINGERVGLDLQVAEAR